MDWKKIAPWNWFKDEESQTRSVTPQARMDLHPDPFSALRGEIDRAFGGSASLLRPSVDISEGKKAYTVRAELPGVELDDVSIRADGQTLVIRAEKRQEHEDEEEGYHCVERSYGAVQRVLSLPEDADAAAIEAKFKNGLLKLRIPKHALRESKAQTIEIERG